MSCAYVCGGARVRVCESASWYLCNSDVLVCVCGVYVRVCGCV